jgi:hypothetical protein
MISKRFWFALLLWFICMGMIPLLIENMYTYVYGSLDLRTIWEKNFLEVCLFIVYCVPSFYLSYKSVR